MNELIEKIANKNKLTPKEGDYTSNGIIFCGKCNQAKQTRLEFPLKSGKYKLFPIPCKCDELEELNYQKRIKEQDKQDRIKFLKRQGLTDDKYLLSTFEKDDNRNQKITSYCKKYVEKWEQCKKDNLGIIFYGDVGTGKSFYACCIANELLNKGVSVLVTNLSKLVKNANDKNNSKQIDINNFDLLIIDDLGVENATQTAYNIIDERYRSRKPLIITTNLTPKQLTNADTIDKKRIYDRVLEMCGCNAWFVSGNHNRLDIAKSKRDRARILFES